MSNYEPGKSLNMDFYPNVEKVSAAPDLNAYDSRSLRLEEQLAGAQNSFVLRPEFIAAHGLDQYLMQSSRFTLRKDWAEGRSDSEQQVFFGEWELRVDDGTEVCTPIAVKPYKILQRDRAVHEYAALDKFQGHPDLKAFEPIGFWVDEYGAPAVLTLFEESVVSLDNVDWSKSGSDPLLEHYGLFTALQRSSQIMARLHINGYAHRDAQIKNMAVDTEKNEVRVIDLTTLQVISGVNGEADEIKQSQSIGDDLRTLVSSVRRRGYLAADSSTHAQDMVKMALLDPHNSMLWHPAHSHRFGSFVLQVVRDITEEILDSI